MTQEAESLGREVEQTLQWVRNSLPTVAQQDLHYAEALGVAVDRFESGADLHTLPLLMELKRYPVDVEEFMFSPEYLGRPRKEIYPTVLEELVNINNPGPVRIVNPYTEAVFTGGIGSAKTTTALYTIAYQLYVLSCFKNPHATFNLDSTSEILFIFQSIHGGLAKAVDYARFREICEQSYYFVSQWTFNSRLKSKLVFPNRIEVVSIAADMGAIGSNVMGGLIDELNFMAIIEKSKKTKDRGQYNQALNIYNGISRRRKSRFVNQGPLPGILCLVSSKNYPGEFTDIKIKEAENDPSIYVYDKRVWEIKPKGTFTQGWFRLFVGDLSRKPRVLKDGETVHDADKALVMEVPNEYKDDFEDDMQGSLRDIAGVSTLARFPYIFNPEKAIAAFGKTKNVFSAQEADFVLKKLKLLIPPKVNPKHQRWAHIDLAITGDACGVCIGHVPRFIKKEVGLGIYEYLPEIVIDGILRITPPPNDEIKFFKVRDILYKLTKLGIPVSWVSFDSFQSVDSIQLLRQVGIIAGTFSVDTTNAPYDMTKQALYDGRLLAPHHAVCEEELVSLEKDPKTGRIDHPPNGSKDVADALAGVVYGLTTRREIWAFHNIEVSDSVLAMINDESQVRRYEDEEEKTKRALHRSERYGSDD